VLYTRMYQTFSPHTVARFLLARLHVDSLRDKRTKRDVLSTLETLPKGLVALDEAYDKATERIHGQLPEDRSLAWRALSWITYAKRLLTTTELCCALAIRPGDKLLDDDDVYDVEDIISVCAELVTVDEESNVIRLVHYTTQKYFEHELLKRNPSAHEEMAVACLTYLSFDTFRSGSCTSDKAFEQRLAENAFFDYSACYWSEHTRPVENATSCLALAFLCEKALVDCATQIMSKTEYKYGGYSRFFPNQTSGLHLTAMHGLHYFTKGLLMGKHGDRDIRADSKDSYGRTPLSRAATSGHEAVVKLLLDTGKVDADSKDNDGRTPLWWAATNGHEAVVKLLLDTGKVDADSKDSYGRTPLWWAATNGHEAVVKLLLDTGKVDADSKDYGDRTPLSWAAAIGHEAVMKLLLDTGKVDADSKDTDGRTLLSWAATDGHEAVVKLLLDTGEVDADSKDSYGRTPLWWAAANGHEAVVKLLLDTGEVDADSKDSYGRTPLWWAAANGHEAVVKLLQLHSL
jgi:ankyrin repeat protein